MLHVTDIAWRRVSHPTEVLSVGQTVTVQIIKINQDTQRISLGMKQLQTDPWEGVAVKYPPGVRFKGKVTNVTDYGAFVELEPGVEGLVHVSEMSWVKKNMAPSKIVTPGQEVDVSGAGSQFQQAPHQPRPEAVHGQSLAGIRRGASAGSTSRARSRASPNSVCSSVSTTRSTAWCICPICPGTSRANRPSPTTRRATWSRRKVLDIDVEKERISLGVKQLDGDPMDKVGSVKKGRRRHRAPSPKLTMAESKSAWPTA